MNKILLNKTILLVAAAIIMSACATTLPEVPPLDASEKLLPGKVVWHDLVTPDMHSAKAFYGGLLGWTFEDVSSGYSLARHNGRLVAGIAKLNLSGRTSHWLPLVSVADMDRVLAAADAAGGKTIKKPFDLANRGRIAVLKDSQGAAFGVVQSSHGDPADRDAEINGWLWDEIWSENVPAAIAFYQSVGGYEVDEKRVGDINYRYLARDGEPRVGLLEKPSPDIGNTWVAYVRVADVNVAVDKAKTLGGNVLMAPNASVRNGTVAVLTDPSGAGFIVQEWDH